nr:hypothetical protein [Anthocerotibacter panamensis]
MKDDLIQWQQASAYIKQAKVEDKPCFINNVVLCELTWVLGTSYKLSRNELMGVLEKILRTNTFDFENRSAAWWSVQQMKRGKADFADYLVGRINQEAGCSETASLDKKVKGIEGFKALL